MNTPLRSLRTVIGCGVFIFTQLVFGEDTWMFAVEINAQVQTTPPRITLTWQPDPHGVTNQTIYRKAKAETSWNFVANVPAAATSFSDSDVAVGGAYEYQIIKRATPGYSGYGYIYAGIEAPLVEARGKLVFIVANTHAAALSNELARLEKDLNGDGWTVLRHDVSPTDTPASVKSLILTDYNSDPVNVNAVFLFGHVPVYRSGNLNYDGHLVRPMPADAFYGDVDGSWNTNLNFLPADVRLMVGRVDFADMPGIDAPIPWATEVELLRNYLEKNHRWRHKQVTVPRRALMGNRRGDEGGEATASSGYRNFAPLVGPGNTTEANIADVSAPGVRWGPRLGAENYLWAFGCGGGFPNGISHLGTNGEYNSLYSSDIVGQDAKAVFVMVFGSWFAEWDGPDNFMRAFLATRTLGLACCMAGRPHWFLHHMGLGEPIGYSARLSMNNSTLYRNQTNRFPRAIYVALMGDPTLRMDVVSPAAGLLATVTGANVRLDWTASGESVAGYHVYRRDSGAGAFNRINSSMITGTTFTDTGAPLTTAYMVRAVKLQSTPSGTYFNASQGLFATPGLNIRVLAQLQPNGLRLTWNSVPGAHYRVQARDELASVWNYESGTIVASGTNTSWTDSDVNARLRRFYRVIAP